MAARKRGAQPGNCNAATHGRTGTPEHNAWLNLRHRKGPYYDGVEVCSRWESFESFLKDMGAKPAGKRTIDRIDNTKGYEPDNCRWATYAEQARNRRSTRFVVLFGVKKCLKDWAIEAGINYRTLQWRLNNGWRLDRAFNYDAHRCDGCKAVFFYEPITHNTPDSPGFCYECLGPDDQAAYGAVFSR